MTRDLTQGSVSRQLASVTVPMYLTMLFQSMFSIIDSMMVGNLISAEALGSVSSCGSITFLFSYVANGYAVGYKIIVGQQFGAKKYKEMREAIYTAVCSMAGISLICTGIGVPLSTTFLKLMDTVPALLPGASVYLRWYFVGIATTVFTSGINNIFYALGETRLPMYFQISQSILHVIMNYVLIQYGRLGILGPAISGIITRTAVLIPLAIILLKRMKDFPAASRFFSKDAFRNITAQAIPACLANTINSIGNLAVARLVNSFGAYVVTGNSIVGNITNIVYLFSYATANAAGSFASQNFGAHYVRRIRRCALVAVLINALYGVLILVLFQFFGGQIAGAFMGADTDPALYEEILAYSNDYLMTLSYFFAVYCCGHVVNELLRSVGKTKITVWANIIMIIVRVGVSYGLASVIGEGSIYWGLIITWFATYGYTAAYFFLGRWIPHYKVLKK
ncbi:MAG: polysaccharide biosynthesis C-terminal domain-containing protein [Clostridia bacterium]|nr:polysaccharide biosynthesis C-terminal domain-containing protein [Clostridia bacterium]